MATSNVLREASTTYVGGTVRVTVLDRASPDRIVLALYRGAAAARYQGVADTTSLVSRDIKDHILFPLSEL